MTEAPVMSTPPAPVISKDMPLSKEEIMAQLGNNPNIQIKTKPKVCPVDPAELALCDSCQ